MQLITKSIKGHKYWYAVQKGRRNGKVTNIKTLYLGSTTALLHRLGVGDDAEGRDERYDAQFPKGFSSKEAGATTALWHVAQSLGLVEIVDEVVGSRRTDALISFGLLLTILAIQRAVAPADRKSLLQLQTWYSSSRIEDLAGVDAAGLDERRVDEALQQLNAKCIERLEDAIVERVIKLEQLRVHSLAFDATNFDSYAGSGTRSRLLKRGHAKSKKTNLRILGLGLLVTADDGIPLLSFSYPGNKADVTSFRSFLRRLKRRARSLPLDSTTTVVCDGGNVCQEVVEMLEEQPFHFAVRLPRNHAPEADKLKTSELKRIRRKAGASRIAARALQTEVYGKQRTVIAVFSESMKESQIPGLERDIAKAKRDLKALQVRLERQARGEGSKRHYLDQAKVEARVDMILKRQHMRDLFDRKVEGTNDAPRLTWRFDDQAWSNLCDNRLGRTAVLTDHTKWSNQKLIEALSEQSHAENAFRQMKDRRWTSALPLRCRNDHSLRIRNFVSVLAYLLPAVLRRRLRRKGIDLSIDRLLTELSSLRYGYLQFAPSDPGRLHALARSRHIPPSPTILQRRIVRALSIAIELGPTRKQRKRAQALK